MTARARISIVCAASALAACARPPPPAPPRRSDLSLKIWQSTLRNGLRVVLVEDPRATEVQVTMRYQVGAVDDPADQPGMAHLVEHLMFQQVFGSQSLFVRLEDVASSFNAVTTLDATTYVARADASALAELLSVEAVRVGFRCTTIDDAVFAREREVVINEVRLRDDATALLGAIQDAVYPASHPYRRSVGGSEATVSSITREQACAFADAHYTTDNAVLVVSGPIAQRDLTAALGKFLAKVTARRAAPRAVVPRVAPAAREAEAPAPISEDALLVAWPLPADPKLRARVRAMANVTEASINSAVAGRVEQVELGDRSAPVVTIVVELGEDEKMTDLVKKAREAITDAPKLFEGRGFAELREVAFNMRKQGAIYDLVADLDDRGRRDVEIAADVLAGRPPSEAIGEDIAALRTMLRYEAAELLREHLGVDHATIVQLKASERAAVHGKVALRPPVHDIGQRQDPPDPADAQRPDATAVVEAGQRAPTRRTLPNGLEVVMVPSTGAPAMEARLVFHAGTGDEPADKRGAALVAAYALTWNLRHINDMLAFSEAGGELSADVSLDHTAFTARGLSMHLDYLLAGLRRFVRDGHYNRNARLVVKALRREAKATDDEGIVTDVWRAAIFGVDHPYTRAGLVRHVSPTLAVDDAEAFRATYYTPRNATLVLAGNFDPVLADQWIDFLFADWKGGARPTRASARAAIEPASTAVESDLDQVRLLIALPAPSGGQAEQLVAAQVLSEIAGDVRHQLGASYALAASVYESRLASGYVIEGEIDGTRAAEGIALIRDRVNELRTDADARARWFVLARRRVLHKLLGTADSAGVKADAAQAELVLGRDPGAAPALVREVRDMTIDRVAATLSALDLAAAAVLLIGRPADLDQSFAVLGRTPRRIRASRDDDDTPTTVAAAGQDDDTGDDDDDDDDLRPSDITDALTTQPPPTRLVVTATAGYSIVTSIAPRKGVDVSGYSISAAVAYRITEAAIGLRASLGVLDGTYDVGTREPDLRPIEALPLSIGAWAQGTLQGRVFGGIAFTLHGTKLTDDDQPPEWQLGAGVAAELGVAIVRLGAHHLGLFGRIETQLGAETALPTLSLGVAYRR